MANVAFTSTRPTNVRGAVTGNFKTAFRDLTLDTGNYVTGGQSFTLATLGLSGKVFLAVIPCGVMTNGTAGVTANDVGITYASDGSSITIQFYESGAANAAMAEKTSAEAFAANCTVRLVVHYR